MKHGEIVTARALVLEHLAALIQGWRGELAGLQASYTATGSISSPSIRRLAQLNELVRKGEALLTEMQEANP